MSSKTALTRSMYLAVLVAALGYFVDIYDLILFSVVRLKSLGELGFTGKELENKGVLLLNMQMGGMLLGGILWGILGDKRGRLSVLFGSIILYSLANIANGFVNSIETYAVARLIAGIGLAGELGAGITLVSESMPRQSRGYGTAIVATVGIIGGVVAALVGDMLHWRTAYFVGGGMGLALLVLRIGVYESGMFESVKKQAVRRGDFFQLFATRERLFRYLRVILVGVPIWYVVGILITFSKEFGEVMGMSEIPKPARAVMFSYIGLAFGDLTSGVLSQVFKSRRKILFAFIFITAAFIAAYFLYASQSLVTFYVVCLGLGFGTGYWAVFVTVASEQFGTNIRATVTTTAPNFVRGFVVPLTLTYQLLKGWLGTVGSGIAVGVGSLVLSFIALYALEETYGKDLDFVEH
jgi:MFS transporter, putative metabolite:H+ symporter